MLLVQIALNSLSMLWPRISSSRLKNASDYEIPGFFFGIGIFSDTDLLFELVDPLIRDRRCADSVPALSTGEMLCQSAVLPPLLNPLAPLTPMRHAAIFE